MSTLTQADRDLLHHIADVLVPATDDDARTARRRCQWRMARPRLRGTCRPAAKTLADASTR